MSACVASVAFDKHQRQEYIKKRFAGIILKSQQTLGLAGTECTATNPRCVKKGVAVDTEKMRKKRIELELRRKELRRQKKREAARREIESMSNTCGFDDNDQVLRDFERLAGYKKHENRHHSLTQYGSNSLLFEYVHATNLEWGPHCFDKYLQSLSQKKSSCRPGHMQNVIPEVNAYELEEGEIVE